MIALRQGDSRPLYEQILREIRRLIVTGALAPQSQLPSVRELSMQLTVNPNTIQRAYRELEIEGYIYSTPGKGSFVSGKQDNESHRRTLLESWREFSRELLYWGATVEELIRNLEEMEACPRD